MKKQVFGLIAALFVCAVLLPVGVRATDADAAGVYAILYEDGTLVFQNGNTPDPGRAVINTYEVDLTTVYTFDNDAGHPTTPWYNECESIRVVSFEDMVSPVATAYWFRGCRSLEHIDNIQNLNTANVTDMSYMFDMCDNLRALDVSSFDTSSVTNMENMFNTCGDLTVLDVSHFDTANVTNMTSMFFNCHSLTLLDVSHFDTANVQYMTSMFSGCSSLTLLDVSHFDTANVQYMGNMFSGCSGLTLLDVSHFDTASVQYMGYMFRGCWTLTTLNVSHWDTANVKVMRSMFEDCSYLKTIYASDKFTAVSVTNGSDMFSNCRALVGGNGTRYNSSHDDATYAQIDAPNAPGYFTYKAVPVDYAITVVAPENGTLSVTLSNARAATLAVAYFDASGKFVSANLQSVQSNAATATSAVPATAATARVMLLDDALCPLCAAFPADV